MAEAYLDGGGQEKEREKMENWYVLFVRTGSEEAVVKALRERLDKSVYTPFIPTKAYPKIRKGKTETEIKICFPSYVFIRSFGTVEDFYKSVVPFALLVQDVFHFLCYGCNKEDIAMHEAERDNLKRFMNNEFCMDGSVGYKVGDDVKITKGALVGMEGKIKKIDRHKKLATVEVVTMGDVRKLTLMLDLTK